VEASAAIGLGHGAQAADAADANAKVLDESRETVEAAAAAGAACRMVLQMAAAAHCSLLALALYSFGAG
jgi:hypothetical protein